MLDFVTFPRNKETAASSSSSRSSPSLSVSTSPATSCAILVPMKTLKPTSLTAQSAVLSHRSPRQIKLQRRIRPHTSPGGKRLQQQQSQQSQQSHPRAQTNNGGGVRLQTTSLACVEKPKMSINRWLKEKEKQKRKSNRKLNKAKRTRERKIQQLKEAKEQRYEQLRAEIRQKKASIEKDGELLTTTLKFQRIDTNIIRKNEKATAKATKRRNELQQTLRRVKMEEWIARKDLQREHKARRLEEESLAMEQRRAKKRAEKWKMRTVMLSSSLWE